MLHAAASRANKGVTREELVAIYMFQSVCDMERVLAHVKWTILFGDLQ